MRKETFYFLMAVMVVSAFLLIALSPVGAQQPAVKAKLPKGQEWTTASQFTFAWDVPTLVDGSPVPSGDVVKYQPYLKREGGFATAYGDEIAATSVTVSLAKEGRYRGCVQAIRYPSGSSERITSEISCSDVAEVCQNSSPWGVIYFISINGPSGLRRVQ